jgi:hypothetical protein
VPPRESVNDSAPAISFLSLTRLRARVTSNAPLARFRSRFGYLTVLVGARVPFSGTPHGFSQIPGIFFTFKLGTGLAVSRASPSAET